MPSVRVLVSLALGLGAALTLSASPALAVSPVFSTTFGTPGSGAGQLELAPVSPTSAGGGVAVDDSTGDIYVGDPGNHRVDKFDASGHFILAFGRDVDQTTGGDICTAASGDVCQAGTPAIGASQSYLGPGILGTAGGALLSPAFIAVDDSGGPSSGDVYVGDGGSDIVSKFRSDGSYIAGADIDGTGTPSAGFEPNFTSNVAPTGGISGIAVDPDGNLWVYDSALVYEYGQDGTYLQSWQPRFAYNTDNGDIAVDGSHVFLAVISNQRARQYGINGTPDATISRSDVAATRLALDPATSDLYVAAGSDVVHYNASCAPVPDTITNNSGCAPSDVFGSGELSATAGIALNPTTQTLYVADQGAGHIAVFVPPPPGPPVITSQWASSVGAINATVDATVNPMRNDTSCQLQYTDDAGFQANGYAGATTVPCDPADVGSRFADQPVHVDLTGLAPGTIYHYRFIASNSAGNDTGTDHTITTEIPAATLPDGRAYEQVSPVDKDSISILTNDGAQAIGYQAASDGNTMAFSTYQPLPGSVASAEGYVSTRGSSGWSTVSQIPPQSEGANICSQLLAITANSSDLSRSILPDGFGQSSVGCGTDDPALVAGEPAGVQNVFLRNNTTGTYQLISLNPVTGPPADASFDAADPSLTHIVFDESAQLTPDAPAGADNLYEWSGGSVQLVSVAANGTPLSGGGTIPGGGAADGLNVVSDDGSKVFFQGSDGNLYARVGGTQTVQLDAPDGGSGPGGGGQFAFATPDGSQVFFTDDASAGLTGDTQSGSGQNLYSYDFSTGHLTDLTPGADAGVLGFSGGGDSGSDVYFVATGDLAAGATAGQPNLYVSDDGTLTFIATLSADSPNDCVWRAATNCARVTPDGQHIAFNSDRSLTAVDTGGMTEIYLYDRSGNHLVCASCSTTGAQMTGSAAIQTGVQLGGVNVTFYLPRSLSDDGSRLFFTSDDPLVARATNGQPDVYEWERQGSGSCQSSTSSGGCIYLISSGTATTPSTFMDASANGNDVFFATAQQLVPSDIDGAYDIYDARVGGGFPVAEPSTPCTGDACKAPLGGPPPGPNAATFSFSGPGNATSASANAMAKVKVTRKAISGARFALTIKVPGRGSMTVSGAGIKTTHLLAWRAGSYRVTVSLTALARGALMRKHRLRVRARVAYQALEGSGSSVVVGLTLKTGDRR